MSLSSFQAPTEARSQGRPGMLRRMTPRSASRARSAAGSWLGRRPAWSRRGARPRARARRGARQAAPPAIRARSCTSCQPAALQQLHARQRAGERLRAERHVSSRRASACRPASRPASGGPGCRSRGGSRAGARAAPGWCAACRFHRGRKATSARRPHRRRSRAPHIHGTAPMPWAPSSSTGTSTCASSAGARLPLIQPTCEQATSLVRVPMASATAPSATTRIARRAARAPRRALQAARGAPRRCVTISSPARSPRPPITWAIPSLVQVVSAVSAGGQPSMAA